MPSVAKTCKTEILNYINKMNANHPDGFDKTEMKEVGKVIGLASHLLVDKLKGKKEKKIVGAIKKMNLPCNLHLQINSSSHKPRDYSFKAKEVGSGAVLISNDRINKKESTITLTATDSTGEPYQHQFSLKHSKK
ncbi:MAG: hypothetical protein JSR46_10910 [Verrucomicrobia bacterium]|nr:hypothetical protein [Verrucomicrobiota bacterium]